MVLRPDGSTYDAYIGTVASWSHVYNDVAVDYSSQGFSIRADKKEGTDKVLFRLPKADTSYRYYAYSDENGEINAPANDTSINRSNAGKLRTNDKGYVTIALTANSSADNDLYVVGNPYMATLDMTAFFAGNPQFEVKYWTMTDGEQIAFDSESLATIAPMQSFFVMLKAGGTRNAFFTSEMTTQSADASTLQETTRTNTAYQYPRLTLTAESNGMRSRAIIVETPEGHAEYQADEDVQTLFDSNTADQPTPYTTAGQQAASSNKVPEISMILFGVHSNDNETAVTVVVEGAAELTTPPSS